MSYQFILHHSGHIKRDFDQNYNNISTPIKLKWSLNWTHWLGVPGGERVGRLWVSNLSSDRLFLLTDSQSVPPNNFLASGLLGDLQTQRLEFIWYLKVWSLYLTGLWQPESTNKEDHCYLAKTRSLMPFSFPYCTDCTSVRPLAKRNNFHWTLLETWIKIGRKLGCKWSENSYCKFYSKTASHVHTKNLNSWLLRHASWLNLSTFTGTIKIVGKQGSMLADMEILVL